MSRKKYYISWVERHELEVEAENMYKAIELADATCVNADSMQETSDYVVEEGEEIDDSDIEPDDMSVAHAWKEANDE